KDYSIVVLLAGALLVGFSMGRWLAPLAAWFGPVLIIRFVRDHDVGRGYLILLPASILATALGFLSIWLGGLPSSIVPFLLVGIGFLWTLPYLADRILSRWLAGFSSTLVYPLAATTLEFLIIHTNPLGTWGATGFTQYGVLPIMQLASVTGAIGITFLMGWFAATINWAWEHREQRAVVARGAGVFGGALALVLLHGYVRLNMAPLSEANGTMRVAGITASSAEFLGEQMAESGAPSVTAPMMRPALQAHWDAYLEASAREAQAGADLVMWPELMGVVEPGNEAEFMTKAQQVASQNGAYLLVPLGVFDPVSGTRLENKVTLLDPSGTVVLEHVKYGGHIIEGGRLGSGILQTAATPFGVLSSVICYDMDYPAVIKQSGRNGTGLMLVPSSDWLEIDPIHTQMAVFRAIENGMAMVRQTHGGRSIAVDAYGRVLAETDFFGATDRTLVAQVPVEDVTTIYSLFGYWLEWLAPVGLLFILANGIRKGRKSA
ncbi:MAG: nitrilase-related carbon-nitrogen hydrolase, partial [Anaerolineales bacterium]